MKLIVLGIISRDENKNREYLLVSSILDFGKYTGYYYPPGGTLNSQDDERTTLIDKLEDELGVIVTPLEKLAETPADVKNAKIQWWACEANINDIKVNPKRIQGFKWLTRKQIIKHQRVWPATKEFFEQYISD